MTLAGDYEATQGLDYPQSSKRNTDEPRRSITCYKWPFLPSSRQGVIVPLPDSFFCSLVCGVKYIWTVGFDLELGSFWACDFHHARRVCPVEYK